MKKWLDRYDKGGSVKKLKPSEIADIKKFIANNADTEDINDPRYYTGKPVVNKAYNVTNRLSAGNLPRYVDPNVKNDPALKWVNAAAILGPIAAMAAPTVAAGAATLAPYLTAPLVVGGSELAAVTPASVAGAYFAHEGYKKLPQTQASVLNAYNNPTRQNILNAANDVGWNTMDFLGTGEAIRGATQLAEPIINKAGKTVVDKLSRLPFNNVPLLNQASKFNPWAFETNPNKYYRQIIPETGDVNTYNLLREEALKKNGRILAPRQLNMTDQELTNQFINFSPLEQQRVVFPNGAELPLGQIKPSEYPFFQKGKLYYGNQPNGLLVESKSNMADNFMPARINHIALENIPEAQQWSDGIHVFTGTGPNYSSSNFNIYEPNWLQRYKPVESSVSNSANLPTNKFINALSKLPLENVPILNQINKINPWRYTPPEGMMYRGLGEEGMKDAIESGLFRAKQNVVPEYYPGTKLRANKEFGSVYFTPKFNTAATYGDNYLAEVPKDAADWIQRYKRSEWSQFSKDPIPIDKGRILKKNWLLGYTPLEVPNTTLPTLNSNTVLNKIKNSRLSRALAGTDNLLLEGFGKLLNGKANRKAIEEGNQWMQNWINHPETQRKIVNDMEEAIYNDELINPVKNRNTPILNLIKEQSLNYRPNAKEYSLLKQLKSNVKQYTSAEAEKPIHFDNWGVSYEHAVDPVRKYFIENNLEKAPEWYGNWISRNIDMSYPQRVGTTVHENTHGWAGQKALEESRLKNMSLSNTNEEIRNDVLEWENLRNQGKTKEEINKIMGAERAYQAYIAHPTEMHARTMELRKHFGITPDMKFDENSAADLLERLYKTAELKQKSHPINGLRQYLTALDGKPQNFANILNNFWGVLPVGLTIGALNNNQNKPNQYKDGGQIHNWREVKVPHKKNQLSGWLDKL